MTDNKRIKYLFPFIVLVSISVFFVQISCSSKSTTTTETSVSETTLIEETTQQQTTTAEITEIEKEPEEEQVTTTLDTNTFLSNENISDCFVGLPLSKVKELQQSKGWPPAFPLNPTLTESFIAKVSTSQGYDEDGNITSISIIVFNVPIGTEIIAPIEGWLAFGGGSFLGDGKGGNNIFIGLNNELGRIEFSFFLKEPMQPIDMDKYKPNSYDEGKVILNIDNDKTTTDFSILSTQDEGNLVLVMREPSQEYESALMSMDFNSFLKDDNGKIVFISE